MSELNGWHRGSRLGAVLILIAASAYFGSVLAAKENPPRKPEVILKEFAKAKGSIPPFQPEGMSVEEYDALIRSASTKMRDLAYELCSGYPDHAKTAELMEMRWGLTMGCFKDHEEAFKETSRFLEAGKPAGVMGTAAGMRAMAALELERFGESEKMSFIDQALAKGFSKGWVGTLYAQLAMEQTAEPASQRALVEKIARLGSLEEEAGAGPRSLERSLKRIGEPANLRFDDALSGKTFELGAGKWTLVHDWYAHLWEAEKLMEDEAIQGLFAFEKEWPASIVTPVIVYEGYDPAQREPAIALARRLGVKWPLFIDTGEPWTEDQTWFARFAVNGPRYVLIDPDGKIAAFSSRLAPIARYLKARHSIR